MDAPTLHDAISEVCPVVGVTVNDPVDRLQWVYYPGESATPQQIAAADNVVATIPIEVKSTIASTEFIGRFTNAEYRAATAAAWRQTAGNAKNWDVVVFEPTINSNKKKCITLRDSLVADGILTQARAAEIFS
jgi:hypothetical protein